MTSACTGLCLALAATAVATAASTEVDFQRRVRPLLSDKCFHCHGPDRSTRMVDLRLDTRDGILAVRKNGAVVAPGKPEESLLWKRVAHEKPALRMPPPYSHKTLSEEERTLLRQWIASGAEWQEHWAFAAPAKREPPAVKREKWPRNAIDRFLLARMEAAGLEPAPEAPRRALVRRVTLDLIGLPPEPSEVEAFLEDTAPGAYERVVERLLARPEFGEHRARYWLDAARYADTHGLHFDNYREMWPYRDWVISAFNRNLPYDKFLIEQLAGDLLPERTFEQQIASGFNRCNVTTNEGGVIEEEVAVMYAKDRVETTATVFLGLTAGCASCHDHKFDPISQKEFYQLAAFFRNTTQKTLDGNIPDSPPVLVVPAPADRERWTTVHAGIAGIGAKLAQRRGAAETEFERWASAGRAPIDPAPAPVIQPLENLPAGVKVSEGPSGLRGLRFDDKAYVEIPAGAFDPAKPFSVATWVWMPKGEGTLVAVSQASRVPADDRDVDDEPQLRGWVLELRGRVPALRINGRRTAVEVRGSSEAKLTPEAWTHLAVTWDGSLHPSGWTMYVNGERVVSRDQTEAVWLKPGAGIDVPLRLGGEGKRFFKGGGVADFRLYRRELSALEAQALALWPAARAESDRKALFAYWLATEDEISRGLAAKAAEWERERRAIRRRAAATHVMQERVDAKPMAHVLFRGQYDQRRDAVEPGVPAVLPPMAASLPRNRLGLAQWLIDPANPLTARVAVNRFWQEVFGAGLVMTPEDFGSQGVPPSHPELLDWLAVEFRESGWDVKKLMRTLVTSAAYRQSAAATQKKLEVDPENRLLARGPRFRMDGETIRDLALAASGLLVKKIGGPSVKPYQPEGIWETVAMKQSDTRFYEQDRGEGLYRRGLYVFWKRAAPPASLEIFNAPSRENCAVRRERTDTPLQALVTLNDPQFVEAARRLAESALLKAEPTFDARLDFLTLRVLARPFDGKERAVARRALRDLAAHYAGNGIDAAKLLAVGESKADSGLEASQLAAWTMLASSVLNLDEALNK